MRRGDLVLTLVLLAAAVIEIAAGADLGPRALALVAAPAMILPVAVRSRAPLPALAVSVAAGLAQALAGGSLSQSIAPFVAVLVLVYSTAPAVAGLALGLTAAWGTTFVETERGAFAHEAGDYVFVGLLVAAAWLAAFALRRRARRIEGLEVEAAELVRRREQAVIEERARIARDLHDIVAHNVSVIVVQAAAAEAMLDRDPARSRAALTAIQETGAQAIDELRRLLGMLRGQDEGVLRRPGLAGIDALVTEFRAAGLPLEVAIQDGRPPLQPGLDLAAYRIVEEALTNSLKHGGGAASRVSIRCHGGALEVEVCDEGSGAGAGDGTGHGLIGMRERAALYDGTLEAGPRAGGGFAVRARLPL